MVLNVSTESWVSIVGFSMYRYDDSDKVCTTDFGSKQACFASSLKKLATLAFASDSSSPSPNDRNCCPRSYKGHLRNPLLSLYVSICPNTFRRSLDFW